MSPNWPSPRPDPPRGSGPGEPRNGLRIFGILACAAVLAIISQAMDDEGGSLLDSSARFLGSATAFFVFPGFIPMIWWGILRFDRRKAAAPLVTWAVLMVLFGYMSIRGEMYRANPPEFMTYPYQPAGCEFVIRFPRLPAETEYTVATFNEVELTTKNSMLRAGCVALDTASFKDKDALSKVLTDMAEQSGLRNVVYSHAAGDGMTVGAAKGTKLVDGRTVMFEFRWYVGNSSVLSATTGGLKEDYPARDVNQFHGSVKRRENMN